MGSVEDNFKTWKNIEDDLKSTLIAKIHTTVECAICSEVMNIPFILTCGHSFCYECLNSWFETKLNCPTCRFDLEHEPVQNIPLKEISKTLIEIIIETTKNVEERNKIIEQKDSSLKSYLYDLKHKNLFGEAFKSAVTLIDRSDGVPRCGNCHWEEHGSVCMHCGARIRIPREDDYYDSDDGDAYNEDDEEVMLYGREEDDRYDSADSFVDNRDSYSIDQDRFSDVQDLMSSNSNSPASVEEIEWQGFDDGSMHQESENGSQDLERALNEFHSQSLQDFDREDSDNTDDSNVRRRPRVIAISDDEDE